MFKEESKYTNVYLSKAELQDFERNPAEHVIIKARETNGDYSLLADEYRWFIGALTAYVLFDGLNG